jgi:perosamine synthetase
LVQDLTFIATANAVSYIGATPHFVDIDEQTLSIDPAKLADYLKKIVEKKVGGPVNKETGRRLGHLVVMHTFGHPAALDELLNVCEHYSITLIEDAAESIGSYYKGRHTGNFGKIAALSFNGNKILTTGGGGAILVNDEELAARAKHLSTTAKKAHPYKFIHDEVGYNYRMPNINAALGCAQLEQLPSFLERKRALAQKYHQAFQNVQGVRFFVEPSFGKSNYWLNALVLDEGGDNLLDELLEATNEAGFGTRPAWTLMHKLPMYAQCPRMDVATAESLEKRIINIPSSPALVPPAALSERTACAVATESP